MADLPDPVKRVTRPLPQDGYSSAPAPTSPAVVPVRARHRLYLRIYLALLLSLALAAVLFTTAWRMNADTAQAGPSLETFAEFAAEILPPASADDNVQQAALVHWQPRVRTDLALYAADGRRIAAAGRPLPPLDPQQTSSGWLGGTPPVFALKLPDGRWVVGKRIRTERRPRVSLAAALALIALAIAAGAYPVVRRLTRRLEQLQVSVEALGAGRLTARVAVEGEDEVARLASSFNRSAELIEALVGAQRSLLANASHELRSPLARIRMAIELLDGAPREAMKEELARNVVELDQLIDEILLASRLDAAASTPLAVQRFDLTAMLEEECSRVGAIMTAPSMAFHGEPKLLRRLVRNLLENAVRHGEGSPITLTLEPVIAHPDRKTTGGAGAGTNAGASASAVEGASKSESARASAGAMAEVDADADANAARQRDDGRNVAGITLSVCDAGPGVAPAERENIFTPFYRLPGVRERDGSVGLGLSLVRQIARRHGGEVVCQARATGGTCFIVALPTAPVA